MNQQVAEEIEFWGQRAATLLAASAVLVEYYGSDDEECSFRECVAPLLYWLGGLREIAAGGEGGDPRGAPRGVSFDCGEDLAEKLGPLLGMLVEWEPDFTTTAREELSQLEQDKVLLIYGMFLGELGRSVCKPIWAACPRVAPER